MRPDERNEASRTPHFDARERQGLAAREHHHAPSRGAIAACEAARDIATKKAKELEHVLSRYTGTDNTSLKAQVLPFLELVNAGGIPLGLPSFNISGEESLELAGIRRAYHEFCEALREMQTSRQEVRDRAP